MFDFMKLEPISNKLSQPLDENRFSLDKFYNITKIHPIERIPDAFFQYKMKDKTIDDLRLDNLREESGTKTQFYTLIEQEKTGNLLEDVEDNDYNRNLDYVLVKAKSRLKSVIISSPLIPLILEEDLKKEELKKEELKKEEEETEQNKEELSNKEEFQYQLNNYLIANYTEELIDMIKAKIKTGTNSTQYHDKNIKTYVERQLKNIHSKEERRKNKIKIQSKGYGTLDSRRYEKTEEENIFDRNLQREVEDEKTKIYSHVFDFHEKDDDKTRIG